MTTDMETVQSNTSIGEKTTMTRKKLFIHELSNEIDLTLFKNNAYILFVISNFLTNLGFNMPDNFANDLAIDENIIEHRRHWIIKSIGINNCIGHVIIEFLG
ncbi:unnamed protein product [Rotaria sordida]|uniref:Uncharacterized protein n=1 Tax=Rotaria sordida TaxID=392033 RepID=A0A818MJ78_9BILA|nr:unnamed protein product [Rotaria sordida]CAF3590131.1 unnamed protein product [Rotaria sordida]